MARYSATEQAGVHAVGHVFTRDLQCDLGKAYLRVSDFLAAAEPDSLL